MSLQAFQRAIVELTLAPRRVRELLRGDLSFLRNHELTEREQGRILAAIRQPGMALNCTIARGNRFESVAELYSMTCLLLKPVLRELLDELWEDAPPTNYQFAGEEEKFAELVGRKIESGEIQIEYLAEIFEYECRCAELARRMRDKDGAEDEDDTIIEFHHPPDLLLGPLSENQLPAPGLPSGLYRARLFLRNDQIEVEMLKVVPDKPDFHRPS